MYFRLERTSTMIKSSSPPCSEAIYGFEDIITYKGDINRWTVWYIEISTLEQLIDLAHTQGELIIDARELDNKQIEIYDGYRE